MDSLSFRSRFNKGQSIDHDSKGDIFKPHPTRKHQKTSGIRGAFSKINWRIVLLSLLSWVVVINHYERSAVGRTIRKCSWSNWEQWKDGDPHRIALFADPQIMDAHSYPGRPALVNFFVRHVLDNYHKRNYAYVQDILDADTTIFLGDLFDGGRYWNDTYWFQEFKRFNQIYYRPPGKRTIMSLPGNHDIGFGETVTVEKLQRFKAIFGPTSSTHEIGNHTIVLLDTISLSNFINEDVMEEPKRVLDSLAPYNSGEKPRILMSHVPLYRSPDDQPCGPLRESKKKFPIQKGDQYQTVIDHDVSIDVLQKIRPQIAFSGDDHDYCRVTHKYSANGKQYETDEITVKSCSMNMGITYPAIQLLSLNTQDPSSSKTFQTEICYLPPPFAALKAYISTAIINVIAFLLVFLLPKTWDRMTRCVAKTLFRNKYSSLPIASEQTVPKSAAALSRFEKDYRGLFMNSVLVALGVLMAFTVYFNAF